MTSASFPWRSLMEFGLGRLGLPPEQFWTMTVSELVRALSGATAPVLAQPAASFPPLARRDLSSLMESFPDR